METERKKGKNHMVQNLGSREDVANFEGFPWKLALAPALTCVQVHYHEEVLFHACLRLVKLFVIFIQFQKNTVSVVHPRCSFLPYMVSIAQGPVRKNIV